jgi:RHS repeat-associated protein
VWTQIANQTTRTWSPPTPKADGSYAYRVHACRLGVCGAYATSITEIVRRTPSVPTGIVVTPNPSTGHFVVSWNASAGASSYRLYELVGTGTFHEILELITSPSYPRDQGNGNYSYYVSACAIIGGQLRCSAFSSIATVTVSGSGIPGEPEFITGPSECLTSACTYTISWGAGANAQYYELHMWNDGNTAQTTQQINAPNTAIALTKSPIHGFSQTTYFHEIRACTGSGAAKQCSPYRGVWSVLVGPQERATSIEVNTAYDAYGKTRNGDFENRTGGTLNLLPDTLRGFTGHQHLDDVQLLHMGGRVYDYQLGRFLSVDPVIGNPAYSQSLNPYSYILNNPLAGKDPTGYFTCDERGNCNGTIGEIEKIDVYKDGSVTASNRDGQTIQLGNRKDEGVRSTLNAFAADAVLGGSNGYASVQGSNFVPSHAPESIESNVSRSSVLPAGQLPSHGDPFGGAILSFGNSLSFGAGSLLFDDSARADVEAFEHTYGAAAAILGVVRDLRNPVAGAKDAEAKIEQAIAKSIPNPWGKLGSAAHREKVAARAAELESQGHEIVAGGGRLGERAVQTPEGRKRFPDISTRGPDGKPYYENIGRTTTSGQPVARERRALDDIRRSTGTEPGYTPYDQ